MHTHTLTHHSDIQTWVGRHNGLPAIARVRNGQGEARAKLALRFSRPSARPTATPTQDDGLSPVSWTAWLAELDRQRLALRVVSQQPPAVEFIQRPELN